MELTFRQKSFLRMLLDLYREARQPLHYTQVAQRLGLGKSSAYDMLRLLERKGLVMSDYVLPKESPSPGRSQVRFWPTARAKEIISMLTSDVEEGGEEWQRVKALILNRLRFGKASSREYETSLQELSAKNVEDLHEYTQDVISVLHCHNK